MVPQHTHECWIFSPYIHSSQSRCSEFSSSVLSFSIFVLILLTQHTPPFSMWLATMRLCFLKRIVYALGGWIMLSRQFCICCVCACIWSWKAEKSEIYHQLCYHSGLIESNHSMRIKSSYFSRCRFPPSGGAFHTISFTLVRTLSIYIFCPPPP